MLKLDIKSSKGSLWGQRQLTTNSHKLNLSFPRCQVQNGKKVRTARKNIVCLTVLLLKMLALTIL